jgi:hypothetical protein
VIAPEQPRRRRPGKRSAWPRRIVLALAVLLVFAAGVALGKALNDGPARGVTLTSVRTLEPLPQQPAETSP